MNVWLKTALALAAVWLLALGTMHLLGASKPTVASLTDQLNRTNLARLSARDRARSIQRVADGLNELSLEDRQQLQRHGVTRRFFDSLTHAEQERFLDATLPTDFKQLMEAFNKMEPAKRKDFVDHALVELQKHAGDGPPPGLDDALGQQVVNQGLKAFYKDANSDVKLDLAPLIEQMQRNLQGGQ